MCRVAVRDARADILPLVAQSSKKVGPGDPAAHRTNRLPLLPSGPGGVHRVLLHRARPRGVCDSTGATGERGWYEASLTITSSQATPDVSHLQHGGEGGHSKSRLRAPTEGACPLVSPPRSPSFESHRISSRWRFDSHILPILYALLDGGEGGIRTHGPFQDNGFRDRPIRPLSHLSVPWPTRSCSLP